MPRWSYIALLVTVTATAVWLGVYRREKRLKGERSAVYQQALRSYTDVLSLGATREQVQDELHKRGVQYEQVYGFDRTSAYADLVKIGSETAPWYCSYNNVYIKFAFDAADPSADSPSDSESDILRSIELTPWLQDCL